jgi:hypothetical protein
VIFSASVSWPMVTWDRPTCRTFPLILKELERADLVGERHGRVDPVQLVKVDRFQPQPAQAQLGLLAQVLRAA